MEQAPQPQLQTQQSEPIPKKGFSLTFLIIITTILVTLGFVSENFLFHFLIFNSGFTDVGALAFLGVLIYIIFLGIPLMIISIILIIVANNKLKSNPNVSKRIAIYYLIAPIICVALIIPFSLSNLQNILFLLIFSPLLIYDWLFARIYLDSEKKHSETIPKQQLDKFAQDYLPTKFSQTLLAVNTISIIALALLFGIIFLVLTLIHSPLAIIGFILYSFPFVFLASTITIIFFVWLVGVNNSETALRLIRTLKTIILLMFPGGFILVLLSVLFGCILCDGGGSIIGWVLVASYIGFLPYAFVMLFFGIPYMLKKAETIFDQESESSDQAGSGTNIGKGNILMADPRFPTLDAQPKPQNTPPDNKKQG